MPRNTWECISEVKFAIGDDFRGPKGVRGCPSGIPSCDIPITVRIHPIRSSRDDESSYESVLASFSANPTDLRSFEPEQSLPTIALPYDKLQRCSTCGRASSSCPRYRRKPILSLSNKQETGSTTPTLHRSRPSIWRPSCIENEGSTRTRNSSLFGVGEFPSLLGSSSSKPLDRRPIFWTAANQLRPLIDAAALMLLFAIQFSTILRVHVERGSGFQKNMILRCMFISGVVQGCRSGDYPGGSRFNSGPYHGKKAVVIGAGPGGSVAALRLAQRGFDVKVFEKRKNPIEHPMEVQRSITFVLTPEATESLEDVGVEASLGKYTNGITLFKYSGLIDQKGQFSVLGPNNKKRIMGERVAVMNALLQAAIAQELPNLEIVFESSCEDVDVDGKVVRFSNLGGEIEEVPYDLLIGADGVNSRVRGALQSSGHLEFKQRKSKSRYLSLRNFPIPDNLSDEDALTKALEIGVFTGVTLKTWTLRETPRSFGLYRTENGCAQMIVVGTTEGYRNIKGKEREWIDEAFPPVFPEEWRELIAERLRESDLSTIGPITYCSSYIGPDVALIGDACHSATATMGMGANRALLDVKDLDQALGEADGNVQDALRAYDEETRPTIAAIQELEMKHGNSNLEGRNPLWLIFFDIYLWFHTTASKRFPKLISPPVHYLMVGSVITPQVAIERFNREGWIFFGLVCAAACAALALGWNAYSGLA